MFINITQGYASPRQLLSSAICCLFCMAGRFCLYSVGNKCMFTVKAVSNVYTCTSRVLMEGINMEKSLQGSYKTIQLEFLDTH